MDPSHWSSWMPALLTGGVLVLAAIVNRFRPEKRRHLRQLAILLLLYWISTGVGFALSTAGSSGAETAYAVAIMLSMLAWAALVSLFLFDLALPYLRVPISSLLSDLGTAALYIVAAIFGMRRIGVDLSGILTTSAIVTGILALSLQATLGNVVGGLALQTDDSIRVGDWIQLENGRQGRVRQIRWRHTVVETRDWGTLIIPNAALLQAQILILGKREGQPSQHRLWVYFNVDFRYSPSDVIAAVEGALRAAPIERVASDPMPNCVCLDFAKDGRDSFAYYAVRYWLTDLAHDDPTSSKVRERIYAALKRAGIPLAVPGTHIWLEKQSRGRAKRKQERETVRRRAAIDGLEFLRVLTEEEKQAVVDRLQPAPFVKGELITRQGAVAHWLYVLTDGVAEVRVTSGDEEHAVAEIRAPGFFGERGLMTGEARAATVVAKTDVECFRLDKEAFQQIIAQRPEMAAGISEVFAKRQVELEAARDHLDANSKETRMVEERKQLLASIRRFFALQDDDAKPR